MDQKNQTQENKFAVDKNQPEGAQNEKLRQDFKINKKGFIEVDGEVVELLPGLKFRVMLDNEHEITATLAGRMRINRITLVLGDRVKAEVSPYDLTKGRITYRY